MAEAPSLEDYSPDQLSEMGRLYATLVKDPATRELTLRATKKISPNTPIPEIDMLDRISKAVKPHIDKLTSLEGRLLEADVKEKIRNKRDELARDGYSKDEIDAIEKLMVEKQIPDHKSAAEFFRLQSRSATPTQPTWQPNKPTFDKAKVKEAGGYKKYFQNEAHQAVDDLRSGRIKLN